MILRSALTSTALVTAAVLLAGCGASGGGDATAADPSASPTAEHTMADGSVMSGSEMDMSHSPAPSESAGEYDGMSKDYSKVDKDGDGHIDRKGKDGQASETATMVCADQIREAVQRTFKLAQEPVGKPAWDGSTYSCTYDVRGGRLVASVRDDTTDSATTGRGYFRLLKRQLPGAAKMKGIIGLGFPNYQSPAGHVVFLKDHKTLHVDASGLPASALPQQFSREDVAYAVASAVMVCWTA